MLLWSSCALPQQRSSLPPTPQAIVGGLVAKTLTSASAGVYGGFNGQRVAPPPVAFDVFSVQVGGWVGELELCSCQGGCMCLRLSSVLPAAPQSYLPLQTPTWAARLLPAGLHQHHPGALCGFAFQASPACAALPPARWHPPTNTTHI